MSEFTDTLNIDVPLAIEQLRPLVAGDGPGSLGVDFPCGLTVIVTEKQAQIVVKDPTPEEEAAVVESGRSFLFVR